jgi:hypothetical protein
VKPSEFPEQTKVLRKPPSMTDEECGSLGVYSDGHVCISLWRPTWRERLSILFLGRVWLHVLSGQTQPPVMVEAKRTPFVTREVP